LDEFRVLMFKKKSVRIFACLALITGTSGCRMLVPPLEPANLQEPGWSVREGQAVWRLAHGRSEIAGDVVVATSRGGRGFVQFTKPGFPLVIAQSTTNRWEVEFPAQNRRYAGRGAPPKRVIWLYLLRVLEGQKPPEHWVWREDSQGWRLENGETGESLEGYFGKGGAATVGEAIRPPWEQSGRGLPQSKTLARGLDVPVARLACTLT
jgi:hypothetical protein